MKIIALRILLIAAILGLWQLSSAAPFGGGSNLQVYFGSPTAIGQALWENRLMLLSDTGVTCAEALLGFVIGALTGVFTAVLFARFRTLDLVVEPIFQALNSIPRPALAPLLIIWFGLGMTSKVAVAWSIVFFIMFYNVYAGVKAIDPDYVKSIRLLGASSRQITRIVIAPAIISWVFAALRLCVTYSLLGAVVGEYVGATNGLGYRLIVAEGLMQTNLLYGIIFILMLLGYALSTITKHVESWLLRWRPPAAAI
jgi:NitT/TauT family transport system permease protein